MKKLVGAMIAFALISGTALARDQLSLAGSSTVLPFATIIAEEMGKNRISKHPLLNQAARLLVKKVYVMVSVQSLSILEMHHLV